MPEALRGDFEAIDGIDSIDDYMAALWDDFHQLGCHGDRDIFGRGGKWNAEWKAWFETNEGRKLTKDDVMNKLAEMLKNFKPVDWVD